MAGNQSDQRIANNAIKCMWLTHHYENQKSQQNSWIMMAQSYSIQSALEKLADVHAQSPMASFFYETEPKLIDHLSNSLQIDRDYAVSCLDNIDKIDEVQIKILDWIFKCPHRSVSVPSGKIYVSENVENAESGLPWNPNTQVSVEDYIDMTQGRFVGYTSMMFFFENLEFRSRLLSYEFPKIISTDVFSWPDYYAEERQARFSRKNLLGYDIVFVPIYMRRAGRWILGVIDTRMAKLLVFDCKGEMREHVGKLLMSMWKTYLNRRRNLIFHPREWSVEARASPNVFLPKNESGPYIMLVAESFLFHEDVQERLYNLNDMRAECGKRMELYFPNLV